MGSPAERVPTDARLWIPSTAWFRRSLLRVAVVDHRLGETNHSVRIGLSKKRLRKNGRRLFLLRKAENAECVVGVLTTTTVGLIPRLLALIDFWNVEASNDINLATKILPRVTVIFRN